MVLFDLVLAEVVYSSTALPPRYDESMWVPLAD